MKITIITPTFNSARTIKDTIISIYNQNYSNIEHIIIDNCSLDKTINIIKDMSLPYTKIISEKDKGIYYAMNKGINLATGDVIGFLNSDDFYADADVLSKVINQFKKNTSLDACYADLIYIDKFDNFKNNRYWKSNKFKNGMFSKGWSPPHPTFFAHRSVYERFGVFNTNFQFASDNEIMMRFLEVHKINVNYVSEVWVKMRLGGISNNNLKNIFLQNMEILKALCQNGLPSNPLIFFFNKIILRINQRIRSFIN